MLLYIGDAKSSQNRLPGQASDRASAEKECGWTFGGAVLGDGALPAERASREPDHAHRHVRQVRPCPMSTCHSLLPRGMAA